MKNRRFLVLLCVSVQVLVGTVLAQQPDQHRATLIAQRKEIAKRYLAAAGLEPPEELDLAHLPQLRAEFNKFLSEPPQPPLSTGDQPAAAPDMHTETLTQTTPPKLSWITYTPHRGTVFAAPAI